MYEKQYLIMNSCNLSFSLPQNKMQVGNFLTMLSVKIGAHLFLSSPYTENAALEVSASCRVNRLFTSPLKQFTFSCAKRKYSKEIDCGK